MSFSFENPFVHEDHEGTRRKTFDKDTSPMKDASPMKTHHRCVSTVSFVDYFHPNAGERTFMNNSFKNVGQI